MDQEPAADRSTEVSTVEEGAPRERGLLHYLGLGLSVALLLLVIGLAAVAIVIPKLTGSIPLTVLTNSMEPGMPPGTLVIVSPVEADEVRIGDVITYQVRSGDPTVITHRVIAISSPDAEGERTFTLQGDNNAEPDPDPIREVQVQGKVAYSIPLLGWVNNAMNGEDRPGVVMVIAGALFAYAAWMLVTAVRDRMRKRAVHGPGAADAPDGSRASR